MVTKPRSLCIERDDECVRPLESVQDSLRAGGAGEDVGELAVHPLEDRGAQQQPSHVAGLALEHLGEQVVGDGALAAGELLDEPLWLRVAGERKRRQPQPCRPPLSPRMQDGDAFICEHDPGISEQLVCFLEREAQVGGPDLGQLARESEAVEPELRVAARREHDPEQTRPLSQQCLELGERLRRGELVQVVDH